MAYTRRPEDADIPQSSGAFRPSSDEAPERLAPILTGPFGLAPRRSSDVTDPESGGSGGVLLFMFPLDGRRLEQGRSGCRGDRRDTGPGFRRSPGEDSPAG